ncbi:MAG: hypothetical protein ACXW0H_11025, partial [Methylobacter sp.]
MKQPPIEITNEQVGQKLEMWFKNKECEAPTCSRERLKPTHQDPIERQWIFQPVDGRSPER